MANPTQPSPIRIAAVGSGTATMPWKLRSIFTRSVCPAGMVEKSALVNDPILVLADLFSGDWTAAREVRLASMRRDSNKPPPGNQGVLSRLFKK